MIRITSFAGKSDQAFWFFRANRSLRRFTPALRVPSGTGDPFLFLSTGAEAPSLFSRLAETLKNMSMLKRPSSPNLKTRTRARARSPFTELNVKTGVLARCF
jgi:hypothetical protein